MTGEDRPAPPGIGDTRGFTLVEVLLVAVIISLLAALAQPSLHKVLLRARAAEVVGDLNVVKVAVLAYEADQNAFPADRARGVIPPGLASYLPDGFSFVRPSYLLDYENWTGSGVLNIGLTFVTTDRELGLAVLDLLGTNVWTDGGSKYTWVIDG